MAQRKRIKIEYEELEDLDDQMYSDPFSYYNLVPPYKLNLENFVDYPVLRFKFLKLVENAGKVAPKRFTSDYFHEIWSTLEERKEEFAVFYDLVKTADFYLQIGKMNPTLDHGGCLQKTLLEARKYDHISRLLLLLTYLEETPEKVTWLLEMESNVFRFLLSLTGAAPNLLQNMGVDFKKCVMQKGDKYFDNIVNASFGKELGPDPTSITVFKMNFVHAVDLVRYRQVFLRLGTAFVEESQLGDILSLRFKKELRKTMRRICPSIQSQSDTDSRLMPLIKRIRNKIAGSDFKLTKCFGELHLNDLDDSLKRSFPPCARNLLDSNEHLKNDARQILGLFLKGIGLSLEQALEFWRNKFRVTDREFDQKYAYNIRHMYGMEGKKANYSLPGCYRILENFHTGCPFKTCDQLALRNFLLEAYNDLSQNALSDVLIVAKQGDYQQACLGCFKLLHPENTLQLPETIVHPIQFYSLSRDCLTEAETLSTNEGAEGNSKLGILSGEEQDNVLKKLKEIKFMS